MTNVVVTVGGVAQSISYPLPEALALAQSVAASINAGAGANTDVITAAGPSTIPTSSSYAVLNAAGATTVTATAPVMVIGNSSGIDFIGSAAASYTVALAGGSNTVTTAVGSTYRIAVDGNNVVNGHGSGAVTVGGGANTVYGALGSADNDTIVANGTGDLITTYSGSATVGEAGSAALIYGGRGTLVLTDNGTADTLGGGSGATTVNGGVRGVYYLSTGSTVFHGNFGSTGSDTVYGQGTGAETVFGGTSDDIFVNMTSLTFAGAGSAGASTIHSATGNDTISFLSGAGGAVQIRNFKSGDAADLTAFGANAATNVLATAVLSSGSTSVTLPDGTAITFAGVAALAADSSGERIIVSTACFARGTLIATPGGEIAVEWLVPGDAVATEAGPAAVVWIGWRRIDLAAQPDAAPIRVRAGALGDGIPKRDLWLSPEHGLFLDGHIVPAWLLLNGTTVARAPARGLVEYLHIELPTHAILRAEGAPAESWLDTGNRTMFENAPVAALRPDLGADGDERHAGPVACAPILRDGARLDALRDRLAGRAGDAPEVTLALDRPGVHAVIVPAGATAVWLVSPAGRDPGDARTLGAVVVALRLDGAAIPLDHPALALGFHPLEANAAGAWRWTAGRARLEFSPVGQPRRLDLDVQAVHGRAAA